MKFEFDSNNATELRAVEAAVAVLLDRLPRERSVEDEASPLVAAVTEAQQKLEAEQPDLAGAIMPVAGVDIPGEADMKAAPDAIIQSGVEVDSAGQPWNPELHSSSRAKVADGTWKKKRGVKPVAEEPREHVPATPEQAEEIKADMAAAFSAPTPPVPPTPVTPPAPPVPVPAAGEPSAEQKIWALITGQVVTINRVLEVARAHGHADLGALRQADEAAKAEVLRVLEEGLA